MSAEVIVSAKISVPQEVTIIVDLLKDGDSSVLVYGVGGFVRDYLFCKYHNSNGVKSKDIDLTTNLSEEEILSKLQSERSRNLGVVVKEKESLDTFGVVFVGVNGVGPFEIAPFRKDVGIGDGRRPEKVIRASVEEDAERRDFTINNLYYDFEKHQILDFNPNGQGIDDIKKKIIRTVGDPFERFREDKLRIQRMIRFFCRFNDGDFYENLSRETRWGIGFYNNLRSFKGMSGERIMTEFLNGLSQSLNTAQYLMAYDSANLWNAVFPNMHINKEIFRYVNNAKSPRAILAGLLVYNDDLEEGLNKLNYPNEIVRGVSLMKHALLFNPKKAVQVLKEKNRMLVSSRNRDLTEEEKSCNEKVRSRLNNDFKDLIELVDPKQTIRLLLIKHLSNYDAVVPDGNLLMQQGLSGKEISDKQAEIMQEEYQKSLFEFMFDDS